MPKTDTKTVLRYLYYDTDFELEESYLSSMGKEGYILTGFTLNSFYKFRKVQSCSLVYKLDFRDKHDEDYLQVALDSGWLLATTRRDQGGVWYYFYKTNDVDDVTELYTDTDSRLDFFRRIQKRITLPLIIIIVVLLLTNLSLLLFKINSDTLDFIAGFVTGFFSVGFVLFIIIYRKTWIKIKQIKDKKL